MPRRILLIRLRLIGDVVLTTPIVRAIRRAWPDAHLAYLVEPHAAAIVRGNPSLDDVIVAPLRHGWPRLRADAALALRLRRARYDTVIDFHGGPRSAFLAWASGAPRRIGYDVSGRRWMYTTRVARPRGHRPRHSVENQWDLLEALLPDVGRPTPVRDPVTMPDDAGATAQVAARLDALGVAPDAEVVVVHVGAGNEYRRWPEESFAALAAALHGRGPNRRIILTTGPGQAATAERVQRLAAARGVPAASVPVLCDLDLAQLRALVSRALVFVGGDSGPAHVAATTAVPMVEIFGPTTAVVWGPWRDPAAVSEVVEVDGLPCRPCDQRRCEPGDFRCLRWITPDRVVDAVERALAREAARRAHA